MNFSDLTVVIQGPWNPPAAGPHALPARLADLRRLMPGARLLLSTWQGTFMPKEIDAEDCIFSTDPGALPAYKLGACRPSQINRQIVTSAAGLARVCTPYALKLRSDAVLMHAGLFSQLERLQERLANAGQRLVVSGHFSVDPRVFEQMPFHFSDWFQFGVTSRLQRLWSVPLMSLDDATHYRRVPHAAHATCFDRRFLSRFTAEQHIWRAYAEALGYTAPAFHNDIRPEVLAAHDQFLGHELVILDPAQSGHVVRHKQWVLRSGLQRFNCLNHLDWLATAQAQGALTPLVAERRAIRWRQRAKRAVTWAGRLALRTTPLVVRPPIKPVLGLLLRCIDGLARGARLFPRLASADFRIPKEP